MKLIYALFLILLFQYSLSELVEGKILKISEDHQLSKVDCVEDEEEKGLFYFGFVFLATTFGFTSPQEFEFFLDDPFYIMAHCFIRFPVEGLEQIIKCYFAANIFPLYKEENNVTLPKTLGIIDDFLIIDWEKNLGSYIIDFKNCVPNITKTFISSYQFSVDCAEDINVLTINGSFLDEKSKKDFISSGEDDYTVFNFQPYLIVDGKLSMADCYIHVPNDNENDDQLRCFVLGFKNAIFFPTTSFLNNSTDDVIRLDRTEEITLKTCNVTPSDETSDEASSDETPSDIIPGSFSSFINLNGFILILFFLLY